MLFWIWLPEKFYKRLYRNLCGKIFWRIAILLIVKQFKQKCSKYFKAVICNISNFWSPYDYFSLKRLIPVFCNISGPDTSGTGSNIVLDRTKWEVGTVQKKIIYFTSVFFFDIYVYRPNRIRSVWSKNP